MKTIDNTFTIELAEAICKKCLKKVPEEKPFCYDCMMCEDCWECGAEDLEEVSK